MLKIAIALLIAFGLGCALIGCISFGMSIERKAIVPTLTSLVMATGGYFLAAWGALNV